MVEVGLRSTRINTCDDVQISIPNSVITDAKIINESDNTSVAKDIQKNKQNHYFDTYAPKG